MQALCLSVIAAVAIGQRGAGERPAELPREAYMPHCLVSLVEEAQIPAEERGVLMSLEVEAGANVMTGDILALIDDSEVQVAKEAAEMKLKASEERINNEVELRYAQKAEEVARAELEEAKDANRRVPGTYSAAEVRRLKLNWEKLGLQIEQAHVQRRIDLQDHRVQEVEVRAADNAIIKRKIDSPLNGIVVELFKHQGEWVEPGEPIMRIVRMDTLRVEGYLSSEEFSPEEVLGREVTIVVSLARGRTKPVKSRISFVSPLVEGSGDYRVWADIENPKDSGLWLVRPGLTVEMTIHLRTPPTSN